MERKVILQNESIDTAGYKKDYKASIIEFIWNGIEANATHIDVDINCNDIEGVESVKITDNGYGIEYENLEKTFGTFLYSLKNEYADCIRGKSNKGKGRYSFLAISSQATWHTRYSKDDKIYQYEIVLDDSKKDYFSTSDLELSDCDQTGTTVIMNTGITLLSSDFEDDFYNHLLKEFAWYLFLNKENDFYIAVNGKKLDYGLAIDNTISEQSDIEIEEYQFNVFFIKWLDGINQKFFYYFMDEKFHEKYQLHTKFNNNAIGFFHSVYIISDYFNGFIAVNTEDGQNTLFSKNPTEPTFKELLKKLNSFMLKKQKQFIKGEVPKVIEGFEKDGVFPKFKNNRYDEMKKKDLIQVVEEVYCIQPKIFHKAAYEQKKTVIGFLNLLLDTDERENIITIIESITVLSAEERASLAGVLKKTSMSRIISTIKMIENRYAIIELLKKLVFDYSKFSSERLHIQTTIEQNYWIFGEQYNLVSADDNFEKALYNYRHGITQDSEEILTNIDNEQRLRRPDIFMCRSRLLAGSNETQLEENIIVELKSPEIELGVEVYRQIEDYMNLISKEKKFNSTLRRWKFIAVCVEISNDIKEKYDTFKDRGNKFLVYQQRNYEIYAMTWDDVFKNFEIRHRYLLDKLNYDKSILQKELADKVYSDGREGSNEIYQTISDINLADKFG